MAFDWKLLPAIHQPGDFFDPKSVALVIKRKPKVGPKLLQWVFD